MNNKIRTLMKKRLGNKKGSAMIEYTIGLLLLVTLVCFLFDVIIIAQKQYMVSQQANVISRQLGLQGGVQPTMPSGFPGSSTSYVTSSRMYNNVKINLENAGLSTAKGEWSVSIVSYNKSGSIANTQTLTPTTNITADYGLPMDVSVKFKYKWSLFGQIVKELNDRTGGSSRHSVSEFKYNYDSWGGEI